MVPFFPELTGTDAAKDEAITKIQKEILDEANRQLTNRILALTVHYKIEPHDFDHSPEAVFFQVIKCLAADFLPGFQLNRRPSETRPPLSHTVGGIELFDAVNKRIFENRETIAKACEFLNRHGIAKFKTNGAKNLETAYHRFKAELKKNHDFLHNTPPYSELIRILGFEELHSQVEKKYLKAIS